MCCVHLLSGGVGPAWEARKEDFALHAPDYLPENTSDGGGGGVEMGLNRPG